MKNQIWIPLSTPINKQYFFGIPEEWKLEILYLLFQPSIFP